MTRRWSDRAWVAAIVAGAVALRVVPMWRIVFTPAYANFQTNDSWYHVRLIEYVVHHFPHPLTIDPFLVFGGDKVPVAPFFDLSVAAVALLLGLGSPSTSLVHLVAALAPVAYGAVTIAAAHAIGDRLFGRRAALLGATLLAIAPGPFLDRTRLGYVDHHAAEACLTALTMLGIMRALDARGTRNGIGAATIAGIGLGCYLLTWTSGAFLVFIITVWIVVQSAVDLLARRASGHFRSVAPTLAMALALVLLFQPRGMGRFDQQVAALSAALAVLAALEGGRRLFSRATQRAPLSRLILPLVVVATVVAAAVLVFYERSLSGLVARMWTDAARLLPAATPQTIQEVRPALFLTGGFSIRTTWVYFGPSFFIGLPACVAFLVVALRRGAPAETLFAVWSLVVGAATFGQNRFGYYFALNAALLTGWVAALWLDRAGVVSEVVSPSVDRRRRLLADGAVILVAALVFYPNVFPAWRLVHTDVGLPAAWHDALDWMKRTQPPAFEGPDLFDAAPATLAHASLTPHYAVMSWWDYGYWILQVAKRVPVANPTQAGARTAGRFFTATDVEAAGGILDRSRARLIVADAALPLQLRGGGIGAFGKFLALAGWGGVPTSRFFEEYQERDRIVTVFYPAYYETMAVRLGLYGGAAVVPSGSIWVITSAPAIGDPPRAIIDSRQFSTYEEAERFAAAPSPGPGRRQIVGRDPGRSCVPLAAVSDYRLIYESPSQMAGSAVPAIRIFERGLVSHIDTSRTGASFR